MLKPNAIPSLSSSALTSGCRRSRCMYLLRHSFERLCIIRHDENPRHVPSNNKNTEFEGRRQNMIGYSCMKAVYERTPYLHDREKYYYCTRHSGASPTRKSASQVKLVIHKETTIDPIRCLAGMKLTCSLFAHKKQYKFQ